MRYDSYLTQQEPHRAFLRWELEYFPPRKEIFSARVYVKEKIPLVFLVKVQFHLLMEHQMHLLFRIQGLFMIIKDSQFLIVALIDAIVDL